MYDRFRSRISELYDLLNLTERIRIADIGANPMRHDAPYRDLLASGLCQVIGFEPQQDTMKELIHNKSQNEEYHNAAIGDGTAATLNLYKGTGLTSFLEIRQDTLYHLRGLRRAAKQVGELELETQRLDEIEDLGRVDFLKIDIQGSELSVFQSAIETLQNVAAVQTEVSFFPLYEKQPSFGAIDIFMRNAGFVPHSFAHIENRLVVSKWSGLLKDFKPAQMLDGDIIYLRDLSEPDPIDTQMLKNLTILSEGVFDFSDVSLKCLDILLQREAVSELSVQNYVDAHIAGHN
ncbi:MULTISPECIES: FkbM family methyltransferase [unclassified Ruegeria]|uniref:FkbM family methyltransferase n=1 Tax=unclassified Ruegeria TaxID=2625375 RepID=UPI00148937C4|nr:MULTISPECIES: FkbM family methyltransferase [unclassified Ruegeria]